MNSKIRACSFVTAAATASTGLLSWLAVDQHRKTRKEIRELHRWREDREALVSRTILATLQATGHDLNRTDAPVMRLRRR